MDLVRVKYKGKNNKEFEGNFIKIGKEHYIPIKLEHAAVELPYVISETDITEMELLK